MRTTKFVAEAFSIVLANVAAFGLCLLLAAFIEGSFELSREVRVAVVLAYLFVGSFVTMAAMFWIAPALLGLAGDSDDA